MSWKMSDVVPKPSVVEWSWEVLELCSGKVPLVVCAVNYNTSPQYSIFNACIMTHFSINVFAIIQHRDMVHLLLELSPVNSYVTQCQS